MIMILTRDGINVDLNDLLSSMLSMDSTLRPSMREVLEHPYLRSVV